MKAFLVELMLVNASEVERLSRFGSFLVEEARPLIPHIPLHKLEQIRRVQLSLDQVLLEGERIRQIAALWCGVSAEHIQL